MILCKFPFRYFIFMVYGKLAGGPIAYSSSFLCGVCLTATLTTDWYKPSSSRACCQVVVNVVARQRSSRNTIRTTILSTLGREQYRFTCALHYSVDSIDHNWVSPQQLSKFLRILVGSLITNCDLSLQVKSVAPSL